MERWGEREDQGSGGDLRTHKRIPLLTCTSMHTQTTTVPYTHTHTHRAEEPESAGQLTALRVQGTFEHRAAPPHRGWRVQGTFEHRAAPPHSVTVVTWIRITALVGLKSHY